MLTGPIQCLASGIDLYIIHLMNAYFLKRKLFQYSMERGLRGGNYPFVF
jgi:hypothetical protein